MYEQTMMESQSASLSPSSASLASLSPRSASLASLSPDPTSLASLSPEPASLASLSPSSASLASLSPDPASLASLSPDPASLASLSPAAKDGKRTLRRGFAVLDADRRKEIARLGGQTAHKNGNAHRFNPEEASLAGKKGGATISEDRDYMADIGRRGGLAKRGYKLRRSEQQNPSAVN